MKKPVKILVIVVLAYVGIVVAFESMIGTFQPSNDGTLLITTFDDAGSAHDRVVSKLESGGQLYVAANHWPRAWYARALEHPDVQATIGGAKRDYRAVPVEGAEHEAVNTDKKLPLAFRVLTGFPPRYFLRLDPR
jgi:F420H(2)-dependent quinone reductase